jgi:Tol biopolymer transport system component
MKPLKIAMFVVVALTLAGSSYAQDEDYWGRELSEIHAWSNLRPAWSPDGKWIAYGTRYSIVVVSVEGVEPLFIYEHEIALVETEPHENCVKESLLKTMKISDLCFTHDSREVTFVTELYDEEYGSTVSIESRPEGYHNIKLSNPVAQIASVNIFTEELRTFADGTKPVLGNSPVWSNDGRYLCYSYVKNKADVNRSAMTNAVTVFDTLTGEVSFPSEAANRTPVRFTSDNSHIICREGYDTYYRIPLDGGEEELITTFGSRIDSSDLSKDGMWAVYTDRDVPDALMVYNTLTGESVPMLYGDDNNGFDGPVFSPDGAGICYIRGNRLSFRNGSSHSETPYILDFNPFEDPGPPPGIVPIAKEYGTKIEFDSNRIGYNYSLSSDGELFAFSERGSGSRIWTAPKEGGDISPVFSFPYSIGNRFKLSIDNISFKPNSREIYFTSAAHDSSKGTVYVNGHFIYKAYNIESVDLDTGEHRIVIEGAMEPSWSYDGRYFVYINFDHMIYVDPSRAVRNGVISIYDSVTGETRYLADGEESAWNLNSEGRRTGTEYHNPRISPDGSNIIFKTDNIILENNFERVASLHTISLEGGEPEILTSVNYFSYPQYSPDGEWILFNERQSGSVDQLFLYNIESAEIFPLVDESCDPRTFEMGNCAVWSRDGSKIYYTLTDLSRKGQIYEIDFDSGNYLNTVHSEQEKIGSFGLLSNYPNPFNPATTISYNLPKSACVKLSIFNTSGQRVSILKDEYQLAGSYSAIWNATGFPSGLYFYILDANGFRETRKMMLVK